MISLAGFTALLVLGAVLLDQGEIITLETVDAAGRTHETQLWIAQLDGTPYLRAGDPASHWLERLGAHPEVEIENSGAVRRFNARVDDDSAVRERLNRAMAHKYGLADDIWGLLSSRGQVVPVRLEGIAGGEGQGGERRGTH